MEQLSTDVAGACACHKMREAARKITRIYNNALQPAGIKGTQFTMLAAVGLKEGATLTDLSAYLGMDRPTYIEFGSHRKNRYFPVAFSEIDFRQHC